MAMDGVSVYIAGEMSMKNYPTLRAALSIFSVELGISEEGAASMFQRCFVENRDIIDTLKSELTELFSNEETNWLALGFNTDYEIDISDEDAVSVKKFIIEKIWRNVFPGVPDPELN